MKNILWLLVLCPFLLGASSTPPKPPPTPDSLVLPEALDRVLRDYEQAWRTKDSAGLAALFTEDGFVLSSGRPPVRGRENIEKRYATSGGPLVLRAFAYEVNRSIGYILGGYSRSEGEPDVGKFTLVLRKQSDGRWYIFSDMDNGNARREE